MSCATRLTKVLIKLAATWEGIAAMKELESEVWNFACFYIIFDVALTSLSPVTPM